MKYHSDRKRSYALKILNQMELDAWKLKYPTTPVGYLPKPMNKENGANALTKSVIKFIKLSGYQAERINTTGRPIDERKTFTDILGHTRQMGSIKWIPGTGTRGSADISATINGRSVKIEIKYGNDRQSDDQKAYQQQIEKSGGVYLIVREFDEFYEWFRMFTDNHDGTEQS